MQASILSPPRRVEPWELFAVQPTSARERIEFLDVLRGFAVLGVFLVNMTADLPWEHLLTPETLAEPDRTALLLVDLLADSKFITIFSFLFGVGFYIQIERFKARGARHVLLFVRRAAGLFLIGATGMLLGLGVSILVSYAIFGLVLLPFFKRAPSTMLVAAILCFVIQHAYVAVVYEIPEYEKTQAALVQTPEAAEKELAAASEEEEARRRYYLQATFAENVSSRLRRMGHMLISVGFFLGDIDLLGLMLIGCYVGRRITSEDAAARVDFARKVFPWLATIGGTGTLIFVGAKYFGDGTPDSLAAALALGFARWPIGYPVLGLAYAAGLLLLYEQTRWKKALRPLSAIGRAALTNYVLQALVIAFITYGWGLGLYGRMGPFVGLVAALVVFPVQVLVSHLWLRRFRQGPLEWIWRLMTYGRTPALR
jgi:uncharacterized protein